MQIEILQGDCMRLLPTIPDESVHAVITDPPYGIDFQSCRRSRAERLEKIANDERPFVWWLYEAYRVVKAGGCILCFCRWDVQESFKTAMEWAGFDVRSQVVWDRELHGMGDLKGSFSPQHDIIWFATKGKFEFPRRRPSSVVRVMRVPANVMMHPNEKPVDLMGYLINQVTDPGETVLDPFAGSGATLVAAVRNNRNAIGIELDPKYADITRRRVQGEQAQLKLPVV